MYSYNVPSATGSLNNEFAQGIPGLGNSILGNMFSQGQGIINNFPNPQPVTNQQQGTQQINDLYQNQYNNLQAMLNPYAAGGDPAFANFARQQSQAAQSGILNGTTAQRQGAEIQASGQAQRAQLLNALLSQQFGQLDQLGQNNTNLQAYNNSNQYGAELGRQQQLLQLLGNVGQGYLGQADYANQTQGKLQDYQRALELLDKQLQAQQQASTSAGLFGIGGNIVNNLFGLFK
jgi:hypothetical protein